MARKVQTTARVSDRQAKIINKKYLGKEEPKRVESVSDLIRAYSWYRAMNDIDDAREWLIAYAKVNNPKAIPAIKQLNTVTMELTMGWIARMYTNGVSLPEGVVSKLDNWLKEITKYVIKKNDDKKEHVVRSTPKDRIGEFLPDFEDALDTLDESFSAYQYLTSKEVPQIYIKRVSDYYQPQLDEVERALKKADKDLTEAYSIYRKRDLTKIRDYLKGIVTDCDRALGNARKARRPRKPRKKSVEQLLKHFQFMEKHDGLEIVSENPEKIIGAKHLIALNTSNNVLTVYTAKDGGLNVHRSGIVNFDEKLSKSKRVGRRIKDVIEISNGGSRGAIKVLDKVNSSELEANSRINKNTILLRIIR